jgi:hypothetical protein
MSNRLNRIAQLQGRTTPGRSRPWVGRARSGRRSRSRRSPTRTPSPGCRLLYQFRQVIEHGCGGGLMTQVPDTFRPPGPPRPGPAARPADPAGSQRGRDRQGTAGPGDPAPGRQRAPARLGRAAASITVCRPAGHAPGHLPDPARHRSAPGEMVSLRAGGVEVTGCQHGRIYDNHKAGRMRRRLPITAGTTQTIMNCKQRRATLASLLPRRGPGRAL